MVGFKFGGPVEPRIFYNREKEISFLLDKIREIKRGVQHNYALVGPRRVGKSSILKFLEEKIAAEGVIPVVIDCEGRDIAERADLTLELFLTAYGYNVIDAYLSYCHPIEKLTFKIKDIIMGAKEKIIACLAESLGRVRSLELKTLSDYFSFKIELEKLTTPPSEKLLVKLLEDTLSLPEKLGEERKVSFVIMLDEFQYTRAFNKPMGFLRVFRRHVQGKKRAAYILSGSSIGMMEDILQRTPFGGHIPIEWINSFDLTTAKNFLKERFGEVGRKIDEKEIEKIVKAADANPAYLNWFGERCCREVKERKKITCELVQQLEERIFEREGLMHVFEEDLRKIGPRGGKPLLTFIEMAGHDLHSPTEISKHVPKSTPSKVIIDLRRLEKRGFVRRVEKGSYKIVDPMLEKYVRRKVHTTT